MSDASDQSEEKTVDALERVILDDTDDKKMFERASKAVGVQPKHVLLAVQQGVSYGLLVQLFDALDAKWLDDDELLQATWDAAIARGEAEEMHIVSQALNIGE